MGSKYEELQPPPLVSSPSISDVSTTGTQGRDPLVAALPTLPRQNLAETAIDEVQQQKDIIAESDKLGELKYMRTSCFLFVFQTIDDRAKNTGRKKTFRPIKIM